MAIIIEDGSGVVDAEVYISVEYLDTFCSNMGYTDHDSSASDAVKEGSIRRGTDFIEIFAFEGVKTHGNDINLLSHPRTGMYFKGRLVGSEVIHENLKKASAYAAYVEGLNPGCLLAIVTETKGVVKREKIDIMETEFFEGQNVEAYPKIRQYLSELLVDSGEGGTFELMRSIS